MGYCKVVSKGNGKVVLVHQLGVDSEAYAEDITIEVQAGVDPARVAYLASQDGAVGYASVGFTAATGDFSSIKFPEV